MNASLPRDRVLLVDDEPQVLVALEDLLSDEFVVMKTGSAEEALDMASVEPDIAVIITDQRMPRMDGDELLTRLQGQSRAARILVTGFADLTAVVRAVNDGRIFAYVAKPWQPDDVRLKVHRAAEHFRLEKELEHERRLLRDLMDNVPDGIYFKDAELRFLRANAALAALLRHDSDELVGKRLSEINRGSDAEETEAEELHILKTGTPLVDVEREHRSAGLGRWFSESKAPIRGPDGRSIGIVGISRDVTLRRAHQSRIARLTRVQALTSRINATIVRTRDGGELLRETCRIAIDPGGLSLALVHEIDPATHRLELLSAEPADHPFVKLLQTVLDAGSAPPNTPLGRLSTLRHPYVVNDVAIAQDLARKSELLRHGLCSLAILPLLASGSPRGILSLCSAHPGFFDMEEMRLLGEVADNLSFALEHIVASERLNFLAFHDELTGLPNRDLLLDRSTQLIAACGGDRRKLALLLVDICRFRQVNESFGRRGGDELLLLVLQRLRTVAGDQSTIARFDSNTFALLIGPIESEAFVAMMVENEIFGVLKDSFVIDGHELRISARVGISIFPSDGETSETLVANAEAALKKAKASTQPYLFYAPTMNARVAEQLTLETKLRRAVETDEFLLHYQPKFDLKTGAVIGLEALIRWRDPTSGLVPPGKFIPVLEETGLIRPVGAWILEHAAAQHRNWRLAGLVPPRIAVNVSALQLSARDFSRSLERTLERYPEGSAGLDLEITESVFVDDLAGSIEKLAFARTRGMSVAIDDFGTGYSSLSYLGKLPIDALKIDRSFVNGMTNDPQSTSIVSTIISLAHSLDLKVIAEGVETPQQAQLLRLLKCDQAQGFLVSPALPAADVVGLFERRFLLSEAPKS